MDLEMLSAVLLAPTAITRSISSVVRRHSHDSIGDSKMTYGPGDSCESVWDILVIVGHWMPNLWCGNYRRERKRKVSVRSLKISHACIRYYATCIQKKDIKWIGKVENKHSLIVGLCGSSRWAPNCYVTHHDCDLVQLSRPHVGAIQKRVTACFWLC